MSDTPTLQDNPEDQLPTPVLPDESTTMPPPEEIAPEATTVDLTPDPKPKRGRPKKADQNKPRVLSEADSDKFDFDSWIGGFPWDQPGMQCKVERIAPEMVGTVQTSGVCGVFDNMPLSSQQVQQQFGGGRYHISVIGPRHSKKTDSVRIMRLSHKPLKIPGDPNLSNLGRMGQASAADVAQQRRPPQQPGGPGGDPSMVRLVDRMITPLQQRADQAGHIGMQQTQVVGEQLQQAAQMKINAADQMLAEKDRLVSTQLAAANQQVEKAQNEAAAARAETAKALEEARSAQSRIFEDRRVQEEQLAARLQSVQGDSNNLIATLLPATQNAAQQQINTMMNMFEARLSSQESSYANRLQGLETSYQNRMEAQAQFFKAQMESSSMLFQGQIQQLQAQLQGAQNEKTLLMQQLDESRNRMMEQISKVNKASDPEEQLVKLGGLLETVKGITGLTGGGDEAAAAASSGNPFFDGIMSNVGKIAEVVPHITGAIQAKAQADVMTRQQQQQPMFSTPIVDQPPQMLQAAPQEQTMQPPPVEEAPQAAPRPAPPRRRRPPAKPKPKGKIPKEELDKAVIFINSALGSNPDLDPADFATMAVANSDNGMLRRLSRQKSDLVVGELEKMDVLHGQVSTEEGKAWLCKLLDVLREKL